MELIVINVLKQVVIMVIIVHLKMQDVAVRMENVIVLHNLTTVFLAQKVLMIVMQV